MSYLDERCGGCRHFKIKACTSNCGVYSGAPVAANSSACKSWESVLLQSDAPESAPTCGTCFYREGNKCVVYSAHKHAGEISPSTPACKGWRENSPCDDDLVNSPAHYTQGTIEVIDAIEGLQLDYLRGSALKYIARAGHKEGASEATDLRKARWFLDRAIAKADA